MKSSLALTFTRRVGRREGPRLHPQQVIWGAQHGVSLHLPPPLNTRTRGVCIGKESARGAGPPALRPLLTLPAPLSFPSLLCRGRGEPHSALG